jgi:hypothetical protein
VGRSVRRVALTLALALTLAGCTTTMHAAQREQLESARQRAALESTRVTVSNPLVTVTGLTAISSGRRTGFVVTVRNRGVRAVSDLPISIGYTTAGGSSVYLNAGAEPDYFDAHLPAIRAGHELTWVYTTQRLLPAGAHTFARVGRKPSAPALLTEMGVRIGLGYSTGSDGRSITVRLQNSTGVPQYELQIYAYAQQNGRYVAAGRATVSDLESGARDRLRLSLIGASTDRLHIDAVPTILQ